METTKQLGEQELDKVKGGAVLEYVVKNGDTLAMIAEKLGKTVSHLIAYNNISNPDLLYPGQIIRYVG